MCEIVILVSGRISDLGSIVWEPGSTEKLSIY